MRLCYVTTLMGLAMCTFASILFWFSRPHKIEYRVNSSSFHCFGDEKNEANAYGRGCVFEDICLENDYFVYYQPIKKPLLYNERTGPIYKFPRGFVPLTQFDVYLPENQFHIIVRNESIPKITYASKPYHILWKPWSVIDANLGHLLWEEIGSMYYSLQRLGLHPQTKDVVILINLPSWPEYYLFSKITEAFLPVIADYWTLMNNESLSCYRNVVVGGIEHVFLPGSRNFGKEKLFAEYRRAIIHRFDLEPWDREPERDETKPKQILLVRKISSYLGPPRRGIANFDEVKLFLQNSYRNANILVVEWNDMSFRDQIRLMLQTDVIITPCGGVSMLLPFLRRDRTAIILDFFSTEAKHGFPSGISASMEAPFWNAWPHFSKIYYQVFSPDEYIFDLPNNTDTRDYASIIVNVSRLKHMLDPLI